MAKHPATPAGLPDVQPISEPARGSVTITRTALKHLLDEVNDSNNGLETGGILLGHDHGAAFVVRYCGGPGPRALRTPDRFSRDLEFARDLAQQAWDEDGSQWIGEWHTHPTGDLKPSLMDLRSYLTHLDDPDLGMKRFLAIIVSMVTSEPTAAAWVIHSNIASSVPIDLLEER